MPRDTIVTDAPISDPDAPFYEALEAAMRRFTQEGLEFELEEHGPTLGYDLLSFVHRPTGARRNRCANPTWPGDARAS